MANIKSYSPINTSSIKKTFNTYIDSLDIPQIDYFAIGVQILPFKKSISIMSHTEWQKIFIDNQFAEHDPIRKAALNTKRNLIPFNEIDYVDNFGKEIMDKRSWMGIKNGIILMERFPKYNYMITLGTGFSQFNAFDFLKRYHDKIQLLKNDMIKIVEKDTKEFLAINSTHLSNGAK